MPLIPNLDFFPALAVAAVDTGVGLTIAVGGDWAYRNRVGSGPVTFGSTLENVAGYEGRGPKRANASSFFSVSINACFSCLWGALMSSMTLDVADKTSVGRSKTGATPASFPIPKKGWPKTSRIDCAREFGLGCSNYYVKGIKGRKLIFS